MDRVSYFSLDHGRLTVSWPAKIEPEEVPEALHFLSLVTRQISRQSRRVDPLLAEHVDSAWEV